MAGSSASAVALSPSDFLASVSGSVAYHLAVAGRARDTFAGLNCGRAKDLVGVDLMQEPSVRDCLRIVL